MPAGPFTRCGAEPAHSPGCFCKARGGDPSGLRRPQRDMQMAETGLGHSALKADPRQDVQPLEGRLPLALKVSQGRDQRLARRPAIRDWVSILKTFRRFLQNLDGISSWTGDTAPRGRRRTSESRPSICSAGSFPPKASASTIDPRTRSGGILRPPGSQLGRSPSCPAPSPSAPRTGTGATHDAARAQPQACTAVQGNQAKRPDGLALDS